MNDIIKKLMEQATDHTWNGTGVAEDLDPVKFAELIVKETLQVARAGIEFGDSMEDAVYRYFGVEEE